MREQGQRCKLNVAPEDIGESCAYAARDQTHPWPEGDAGESDGHIRQVDVTPGRVGTRISKVKTVVSGSIAPPAPAS